MSHSKLSKGSSDSKDVKAVRKTLSDQLNTNVLCHIMRFLGSYSRAQLIETCHYFHNLGCSPASCGTHVAVDLYWLLHSSGLQFVEGYGVFTVPKTLVPGTSANSVQHLTLSAAFYGTHHNYVKGQFSLPLCFPNLKTLVARTEERVPELDGITGKLSFLGLRDSDGKRVSMPKLDRLTLEGRHVWNSPETMAFVQPSITDLTIRSDSYLFHPTDLYNVEPAKTLLPNVQSLRLEAYCEKGIAPDNNSVIVHYTTHQALFLPFPQLRHLHLSRIGVMAKKNPPNLTYERSLSFHNEPCASRLETFRFLDGYITSLHGLQLLTNLRELALSLGALSFVQRVAMSSVIGRDIVYLDRLEIASFGDVHAQELLCNMVDQKKRRGGSTFLPQLRDLSLHGNLLLLGTALYTIDLLELFGHPLSKFRFPERLYTDLSTLAKKSVAECCESLELIE